MILMLQPIRTIFAIVAMHATLGHPGLERRVGDTETFPNIAKDSVALADCLLYSLKRKLQ